MVTVDLETGKNLIIWEKKGLAQVIEYNIYRESIVAGQYERIGQLPYNALSVFVDTIADPSEQAWIYKITATESEGFESNIEDNRLKTGIYDSRIAGNLTIYPNPFNEMTTLKFPNPENNLFRLRVIDLTGKILCDINGISGSDYVLERDDLEKGYYIIELSGDKVYRGRIVVE